MKNKQDFFYLGGGIIVLILLVVLIYQKNGLQNTLNEIETQSNKYGKHQLKRDQIEGSFLWETKLLTKKEFEQIFVNEDEQKPKLFFIYDSLGCQKCYNFHKQYLTKGNSIIFYNNEFEFMLSDFRNFKMIAYNKFDLPSKQVVMLVDFTGRILRSDFLEFEDLGVAEKFYEFAERIIEGKKLD
ncbi:MAG: hypothetical protein ACEPO8_09635 [Rhodothermaceae bacterium]